MMRHRAATTRPAPRRSPPRPSVSARAASRCAGRSACPRPACSPALARCTRRTAGCRGGSCAAPRSSMRATAFAVTHHYRHFAGDVRPVLAADARSRAVFLGNLDVGVPPLAALIRQPDLARTLEEIAQDGAETFYRGRLAKRLAAGMREAGVLVDERDLEACQPQLQDPIGIALSRLPRHPDAAELHRLHHAADAEDRRTLRSCRARSGAAHPCAGGGEEARIPGSRALRHRSALRRRAAGPAAVGRLRR